MMLSFGIVFFLSCGGLAQDFQRNLPPERPAASSFAPGSAQEKQAFHQPLAWKFPEPPAEEARFPPRFELRRPVPADSVSVSCGENSVRVEAKKDLLGIGRPVPPADVTLGGCPAAGEDAGGQTLIFESELHGCGSRLTMSEDSFSYAFTLLYTPSLLGNSPIVRTTEVSVSVECRYPRKLDVSSEVLKPTWTPLAAHRASEENLLLSLRLMTDDWQSTRPSAHFLLGDTMKFEASVQQFHHVPLTLFVDSCVATLVPNANTVPRYAFLGNRGCLVDSKLTGSGSRFLPRSQNDKLHFQIEAFRFQQNDGGSIYITCELRAAAAAPVDASNKACSFSNGWREASGRHQACSCCDTDCRTGSQLATSGQWEQETTTGPITVKERPLR